ncbi:hypothetical protein PS858_03890 [Pseudomonas fluorescens]|jgi:hypothetical protein|nr:hypothetical protein PS858_03890 [Pseudomonas fluorescens]
MIHHLALQNVMHFVELPLQRVFGDLFAHVWLMRKSQHGAPLSSVWSAEASLKLGKMLSNWLLLPFVRAFETS